MDYVRLTIWVVAILLMTVFLGCQRQKTALTESAPALKTENGMILLPGGTFVMRADVHKEFFDAEGRLNKKLTNDGLHLLGEGCALWTKIL